MTEDDATEHNSQLYQTHTLLKEALNHTLSARTDAAHAATHNLHPNNRQALITKAEAHVEKAQNHLASAREPYWDRRISGSGDYFMPEPLDLAEREITKLLDEARKTIKELQTPKRAAA